MTKCVLTTSSGDSTSERSNVSEYIGVNLFYAIAPSQTSYDPVWFVSVTHGENRCG